jgi:uncharacterized membrane protein YfcA
VDSVLAYLADGPGIPLSAQSLLVVVSFAGSALAATLGLGGGALVLAVMALYFPPAVLIPLHGVVQVGSNCGRAALMIRQVIGGILPIFIIGSIIGAVAGAKLVVSLPVSWLQLVVALFVIYAAWGARFKFSGGRPSQAKFFIVGMLAAFATMFVGATGPLIAPFVISSSGDRRQVVATHAMLMTVQHGVKILAFGFLGFAFWPYVPFLAAMLVAGFAGTWFGRNILYRLPEHAFRLGFSLVLTLLALELLWRSLPAVLGLK